MKFIDSLYINLLYKHKNLYLVQFLEKFLFEITKLSDRSLIFMYLILQRIGTRNLLLLFACISDLCQERILSMVLSSFLIFLLFFYESWGKQARELCY